MNKNFKYLLVCLFALAISFGACRKRDNELEPIDNTPAPAVPYFTFGKVSNETEYETKTPVLMQTYTGTMTQKVLSKSGADIFTVETFLSLGVPLIGDSTYVGYWKISSTQFASVDDELGTNPFPYYTKDDAVNKSYALTDTSGTRVRTVLSINESVTTVLGTFNCIKVKETRTGSVDETTYYINKDVGLVKSQVKMSVPLINALNIEINLVSKNF
jgi:hypothetical protein